MLEIARMGRVRPTLLAGVQCDGVCYVNCWCCLSSVCSVRYVTNSEYGRVIACVCVCVYETTTEGSLLRFTSPTIVAAVWYVVHTYSTRIT